MEGRYCCEGSGGEKDASDIVVERGGNVLE